MTEAETIAWIEGMEQAAGKAIEVELLAAYESARAGDRRQMRLHLDIAFNEALVLDSAEIAKVEEDIEKIKRVRKAR